MRRHLGILLNDSDHNGFFGAFNSARIADFKTYSKHLEYTPFTDEEKAFSQVLTAYARRNRHRERYKRLRDTDLRCMKDRLLGFIPGFGYLKASDKRSWDYLIDLRNCLISEVEEFDVDNVNLLLINYAKRMVHVAEMDVNLKNVVDESYYDKDAMSAYADMFDICSSLSNATLADDEVRLANKKTTSLGFPYETVDGIPVTNEMLMRFVRPEDNDLSAALRSKRYVKDWSDIKSEWRADFERGCAAIFNAQRAFLRAGGVITPSNVTVAMETNLISVHSGAQRENCAKPPKNLPRTVSFGDKIYTEDRNFAVYETTVDGVVGRYDGVLDIEKYTDIVDAETGMFGGVNRNRRISPSNNVMHTMGTLYAHCALYRSEHNNKKGNPTPRPIINEDIRCFYDSFAGRGYKIGVFGIDCVNAEVTVTTNHELFSVLVPERVRPWYKLTACSVVPYRNVLRYRAGNYCSAVWYTTWFHVLKGNFEMARIIHYLGKRNGVKMRPLKEVVRDYIGVLMLNDEHELLAQKRAELLTKDVCDITGAVRFGDDLWVNPKLGTDDVVVHVATKRDLKPDAAFDEMLRRTMMNFEMSFDEPLIAFGSRIYPDRIEVSEGSKLSKIHYSEHLGFSLKDGFSTYAKMLGSDHMKTFDWCLRKHFGAATSDYAVYADGFMSWLQARGVGLDEVFNEYSPHEHMLLQKFMAERYGYSTLGTRKDASTGEEWAIVKSEDITFREAKQPVGVVHKLRELLADFWR